ncbi:unnamed protein product [Linum trigynum]|uniref:Uncharacterized protein n=1 Tax=Linum trigynum TaxID=586398 RepID=A0AAV2F2S8_9ROSI
MALPFLRTFTGTMFLDPIPANAHRHTLFFENRQILPTYHVQLDELTEVGLDVRPFIQNLGWNFLLYHPFSTIVCPDAVRFFYSNLRFTAVHSRFFTTLVFGNLLTIPVAEIERALDIPVNGENLEDESELGLFNFDLAEEFHQLTSQFPGPNLSMPVSTLLPSLRALHFFISRVFLPHSGNLMMITPVELWVLAHAAHGIPLNYAPLFFGSVISFCDVNISSPLPFGCLITSLLLRLRVNLHPFATITPSLYLSADNVMDLLEIAVEGENGANNILVISSDSDSDSSSSTSDDAPKLEPFAAALRALYGSDSDNEAA